MKKTTSYEWVLEELDAPDEDADIVDNYWFRTYKEAMNDSQRMKHTRVAVMFIKGNEEEGETERGYAYVGAEGLPDKFDTGRTVPARFHKEIKPTTKDKPQ